MRFKKFICFYGKLNEAFVCQGHYLDACALRNSVAVTGDVRTHFAFRFHADAHAGCMQISRRCAGIMHADFTRAAKFICFSKKCTHAVCTQISFGCARKMHADFTRCATFQSFYGRCAHALCMQMFRGCACKSYACIRGPEHEA